MKMNSEEYYLNPCGEIMICTEAGTREYCQQDKQFTASHIERIKRDFPEVYDALTLFFKSYIPNPQKFDFVVVRQFLACRHGNFDITPDLDESGNLHKENVCCPIRAVCPMKQITCQGRITSKLSPGEYEVMRLLCNGATEQDIASARNTSITTVVTQRQNAYAKFGVNSKAEFIIKATKQELFK